MSGPADAGPPIESGGSGPVAAVGGVVVGIGVDAVDPERLGRALARRPRLEERLFTPAERALARGAGRLSRLSARFAAKEATWKALGVGLGDVGWREVEVVGGAARRPALWLHGRAARLASSAGVRRWHLSLSHTERVAIAMVVAEGERCELPPAPPRPAPRPSGEPSGVAGPADPADGADPAGGAYPADGYGPADG